MQQTNPQKCDNDVSNGFSDLHQVKNGEKEKRESFGVIFIINVSWILISIARMTSTAQYVC